MKKKRKEEQPISMNDLQLRFANNDSELFCIVSTNISAYEFVNDVLSNHYVINKNGKRENVKIPKYIPTVSYDSTKTKSERILLKKYKSEYKASNRGRKLHSVKVS